MTEKFSKDDLAGLPFMDSNLELEKRVEDLLGRLTLEEKFKLLSGTLVYFAKPLKRLGIKKFKMTDGPHGVGAISGHLRKITYFPVAICRCATWNPELSEKFGAALAREVRAVGYHEILAPGINIQRTPLCGRTFEYQTEDPYLNTKMVVPVVKGVQGQRIAACVKHYACNNQDTKRMKINAVVGERALHEIYFPAYEATVREADAWSFMGCYNRFNGVYGCANEYLLREKLMNEWGFRGFVVSDWFAASAGKLLRRSPLITTEGCMNAGLSLEMPWAITYRKKHLRKALEDGKFTEETLNDNVKRFLRVLFLVGLFDDESLIPKGSRNTPEHQEIARQIAEEGIVLLKNDEILPLDLEKLKKIAVIGPNRNKKMGFAGGSSMVRAKYEITPLKGLKEKCKGKVEITKNPVEADLVIIIAGLNHSLGKDSEGKDKKTLDLPQKQVELINATVKQNPKTIVVLVTGSPVTMDAWIENVPVVVEAWYAGSEGGRALANVLFGEINPSGKLPITFPNKLSDSPAHASRRTFPGDEEDNVYYEEGIFVGYRHFDTKNIEPLFPFGHGLSYTTFTYDNLKTSKKTVSKNDIISITAEITNSGDRAGAEVVQLYVQDVESSVERPLKELKGFQKVFLKPGEKTTVKLDLNEHDLSFYDDKEHAWKAEKGMFKILVGSSSRDIRLQDEIEYSG